VDRLDALQQPGGPLIAYTYIIGNEYIYIYIYIFFYL